MKKIVLSLLVIVLLTGCASKMKEVSEKTNEETVGTKETSEKISKSNKSVKYEFESKKYSIVLDLDYNKKFKYKDNKLVNDHYDVSVNFTEYEFPTFNDYKISVGYESITIDGKEAVKTVVSDGEIIMIKISEEDIVTIVSKTDGTIMNTEMTEDKAYKDLIGSIKITVNQK